MPSSSRTAKIVRYVLIAVIVVALIGLLSWYFFLRAEGGALRARDEGRGAGMPPPSFGNVIGSTYGNIVENISSLVGGGEKSDATATPPRLWQITKTPVAGMGFVARGEFAKGSTTPSTVRFVERGTGYVLDADPVSGTLARLTNTLVPRVYEALVGPNGVVVLRGFDDEAGFVLTNTAQATSTLASGEPSVLLLSALPQDIRNIALSPSGEEILYLIEQSPGFSIVRAAWDGESPRRIASVGISGWLMRWLPDGRVILTQNATEGAPSYVYELDEDGSLSPLVPGGSALALLPRADSSALIYGSASGNSALVARVDANTSAATLPIRTPIDKCVWAPGMELVAYCAVPTALPSSNVSTRFRGEIHTADTWWKVDVSAGRTELLYNPGGNVGIDVENPAIDALGNYIAFMNARDKSLWLLRVAE